MTGYGMGVVSDFKVEVRSTNHRHLHIQVTVPPCFYYYEPEIKRMVKENFHRGHIEIFLSRPEANNIKLKINKSLAREYYDALVSLKNELSIPGDVGIDVLVLQKDIFLLEEAEVEIAVFRKAIESALEELKKMRIKEGKNLVDDITKMMHLLNNYISHIEEKRAEFIANAKVMLAEKLKNLLSDILIDESRLIQEVAILIERSDITEEIVRIKSHLKYMEDILKQGGIVGKKMDFLAQELYRELNTIGSKAASAEISTLVVEMKNELEKIREQIQNLE